jgi:hypothetical protein
MRMWEFPALIIPGSRKGSVSTAERPGYRRIMIDFPDGTLRREQDLCREKLDAAGRIYADKRSPENRAEYLRILRAFTELVMNGKAAPVNL